MNRIKVIDTDLGVCTITIPNVFRIETDPDDMTCKVGYIDSFGEVKYERIKVGPNDTNKVVIF